MTRTPWNAQSLGHARGSTARVVPSVTEYSLTHFDANNFSTNVSITFAFKWPTPHAVAVDAQEILNQAVVPLRELANHGIDSGRAHHAF